MTDSDFTPEYKVCRVCEISLHHSKFYKSKTYKNGIDRLCKSCKIRQSVERNRLPENVAKKSEMASKKWRENEQHRMRLLERQRRYRESEIVRARQCELQKSYQSARPDHYAAIAKKVFEKRKKDPAFICSARIRAGINFAMKGARKARTTFEALGYTASDLRLHIERQFTKGMSWENAGDWHIDHIMPLSSFVISGWDDPELKRAWALSNLRPFWARDNMTKRDKITHLV